MALAIPVSLFANRIALRRLAQRVVRCPDLADEAVQEALIAYWKLAEPPRRPDAWLAGAVLKRSLHLLRAETRRRTHECAARADCPSRTLRCPAEERELRELINAALDELPVGLRRAWLLYEREGRSYAEIAEAENLPLNTVRSRIHRARRALASRLTA